MNLFERIAVDGREEVPVRNNAHKSRFISRHRPILRIQRHIDTINVRIRKACEKVNYLFGFFVSALCRIPEKS